jgi:ABC-2 type transport system ATP-binding protein
MLEIKNYSKNYGPKTAVKNLSLTIEKGDIYGFIGHNGAGKTTTIKAITGILPIEQAIFCSTVFPSRKNRLIVKRRWRIFRTIRSCTSP